ncbi:hypothetical protein pb186bvf_017388 [Paramecium bursaria]
MNYSFQVQPFTNYSQTKATIKDQMTIQHQEKVKRESKNKVIYYRYNNMTKKEAQQILQIQIQHQEYRNYVKTSIILHHSLKQFFYYQVQDQKQKMFNNFMNIEFQASQFTQPIVRKSLIIINGNRKSKRKDLARFYQQRIIEYLQGIKTNQQEVLFSIYGFVKDNIIDLLSVDQDFSTIKDKKLKLFHDQDNNVQLQNLLQMAITNIGEYESILNLYKSLKTLIEDQTQQEIDIIIFQLMLGQTNEDGSRLENFQEKFNIVLIRNSQSIQEHIFHLGQCLNAINNQKHVPIYDSLFTQSIGDQLNDKNDIIYLGAMTTGQDLESQLHVIKFMDNFKQNKTLQKKNQRQRSISDIMQLDEMSSARDLLGSAQNL